MTEAKPLGPSSHSFSITFRRLAGQISPEPCRREIERMVADAEAHRSEDAALRAQVDARNELDTVAYQVQRTLDESAGRIPEHERARAELLVSDARTALDEQADIDRLRPSPVSCTSCSNHLAASAPAAPRLEYSWFGRKARAGNQATTPTM